MSSQLKVCAVLTAFNRRDKTCASLRAFFAQRGDFKLSAVLMDDGSTDGTADAVSCEFSDVTLLQGDGSLFWNRGMASAFSEARKLGGDYFLWLNDDTILNPDALERLIRDAVEASADGRPSIVVGSTVDPDNNEFTYGGLRSVSDWHAGKFQLVHPTETLQSCNAMNGNIVLVDFRAAERIGDIDERFSHSMGDYDYGLRARKAEVHLVVGRGFHGECPRNPPGSAWTEQNSVGARLKLVNSPKGLPFGEWAYFLRKHGDARWPLAWLTTYRRIVTG